MSFMIDVSFMWAGSFSCLSFNPFKGLASWTMVLDMSRNSNEVIPLSGEISATGEYVRFSCTSFSFVPLYWSVNWAFSPYRKLRSPMKQCSMAKRWKRH